MRTKSISLVAVAALVVAGCGVEPETLESLRNAVNTVSATNSLPKPQPVVDADPTDSLFQPSYPDRVNPFTFPRDADDSDRGGANVTSVVQVQILGFAEVDEPRVFLRTNERTKSMRIGEIFDGVEVVAIHPPAVELRMGNLVWTATMFDQASTAQP